MTLVLACDAQTHTVLAADRLVRFGPLGGPYIAGEADKLFIVAGCLVASFGISPPGFDVPNFIRTFDGPAISPEGLSNRLHQQLAELPDRGSFGLLVAGCGHNHCELWELGSNTDVTRVASAAGEIIARGHAINLSPLPNFNAPNSIVAEMLSVLRQAEEQTDNIGHPFDVAVMVWPAGIEINRYDI